MFCCVWLERAERGEWERGGGEREGVIYNSDEKRRDGGLAVREERGRKWCIFYSVRFVLD